MNYSAKKLNGTDLPNRWTVEVTYRDGSSPTTFKIEELADIDERIELCSDWSPSASTDVRQNRRRKRNVSPAVDRP